MGETLTNRLQAIKNDNAELVNILELNAAFDKFDNHFIPAAKMYNTVLQLGIPNNVATKTVYDTIAYDTYAARPEGPMASLALNQITIRKDGIYTCSINGNCTANATGVRRLDIQKNGVLQLGAGPYQAFVGGQNGFNITVDMALVAGDIITGSFFQNSGVALDFGKNTFVEGDALMVSWKGSLVAV
jgi:hypothetical protein